MPSGLLTADSPGIGSTFGPPQWGIFSDSGTPLLVTDSTADVEYARDYRISDYPQEKGAFQSYNKVQVPFQAKVGFYISQTRTQFLNAIEEAVFSLNLVTVVTPEIRYSNANLTHYSYRREVRAGVSLIRVEVWCEEVRIVSGVALSKSQSTNAAAPTQSGDVQSVPTTQNAPVASDGTAPPAGSPPGTPNAPETNGGSFSADRATSFNTVRNTDVFIDPNTGLKTSLNPDTTIPAGVPNSTGGGESAVTTSFVNSVNESAAVASPF